MQQQRMTFTPCSRRGGGEASGGAAITSTGTRASHVVLWNARGERERERERKRK